MITFRDILLEGYALPADIDKSCDQAAELIASMFASHFKKKIEHMKTASDERIVKYHEYYRLAMEYKKNRAHFKVYDSQGVNSTWGEIQFLIKSTVTPKMPGIFLKLGHSNVVNPKGEPESVDGYVKEDDPTNIWIMVDVEQFVKAFKMHTEYLREVVKHEVRHALQIESLEWKGKGMGVPKTAALNPKTDFYGFYNSILKGYGGRVPHAERPIEFKPNVHTYAYWIKKYLNKNYPKSEWKTGFTKLLMLDEPIFGGRFNDEASRIAKLLDAWRVTHKQAWKIFIKELYKEIFKDD